MSKNANKKTRTPLTYKQKQHIKYGVIAAFVIAALIAPFLYFYCCVFTPATEEEMKYFESVAKDIYYQEKQVLYEVPDDVCVSMDEFSIKVNSADDGIMGSVTATVEDGELVIEHTPGDTDCLALSIIAGLLISFVALLLICIILAILGIL